MNKIVEFVPKISEYANTQNKVNRIFANHPFHTNIENLVNSAQYPIKENSLTAEKWFTTCKRKLIKTRLHIQRIVKEKLLQKNIREIRLIQKLI